MYYSLTGKVVMKDTSSAAIDCSGVAYLINTTLSTINSLPPVGETERVLQRVRQDGILIIIDGAPGGRLCRFLLCRGPDRTRGISRVLRLRRDVAGPGR